MEYIIYVAQLNYAVLKIEYFNYQDVEPPLGSPDWLTKLVRYYFDEFSNSKDELIILLKNANSASSFDELRLKMGL